MENTECMVTECNALHQAKKLDSRIREASVYLGELRKDGLHCQVVAEEKFLRNLQQSSDQKWDHLYKCHQQDLQDLQDY